jgi:hypothetical protein
MNKNKIPLMLLISFSTAVHASIVLEAVSNGAQNSTEGLNVSIDSSGVASSDSAVFSASGSIAQTGVFGSTVGVEFDAMKNTSVDPETRGDKLANGQFNWDSNVAGVWLDPNAGGIGYSAAAGREGIQILLDASGIGSASSVQITSINVQNVFQTGESFFVVNLSTREYIEFSSGTAGDFDVSSLGLTINGGNSGAVAALYSGDVGGFRFKGVTLDVSAVPEATSSALLMVSSVGLLVWRRCSK